MKLRKTETADTARVLRLYAEGRESLAALGIDQWQNGYPGKSEIEADMALGIG